MALGVPVDSAKQIASLLVSFGLIDDDQFNHANTSSTEGGKCLVETLSISWPSSIISKSYSGISVPPDTISEINNE